MDTIGGKSCQCAEKLIEESSLSYQGRKANPFWLYIHDIMRSKLIHPVETQKVSITGHQVIQNAKNKEALLTMTLKSSPQKYTAYSVPLSVAHH